LPYCAFRPLQLFSYFRCWSFLTRQRLKLTHLCGCPRASLCSILHINLHCWKRKSLYLEVCPKESPRTVVALRTHGARKFERGADSLNHCKGPCHRFFHCGFDRSPYNRLAFQILTHMIGKRAKILSQAHVEDLLFFAQHTRHPIRNQAIVLLSIKAGLRAAEIANLTWDIRRPEKMRKSLTVNEVVVSFTVIVTRVGCLLLNAVAL
jgi:hypothetical protein